ncbi:MAG TPA: TraR/DksA C4-type zinc finger protein [Candidatus Limnocylindrales bacterium]|nr:TraR/DksA C4-type zinc finger protein [Candidatus Limnocylindrales bacterium]
MGKRRSRSTRPRQSRPKPRASTQDVVGQVLTDKNVAPKWRQHYRRLLELRDHLVQQRRDLAKDALEEQPTLGTHLADAGTDTYDQDFALGMLSSEQDALYEIEEALERIRNRTYGICEVTGRPIKPARLEAIPWTRFGAEAENQLERQGMRRGPHLGPREGVPKDTPGHHEREAE